MKDEIIKFLRSSDYQFVKELGHGACGRTVELYDEVIDESFVCKKYEPQIPDSDSELFNKFIQEIKLLYKINHRNIVRVFSYHIYPEHKAAFIIMEKVDGKSIDEYLVKNPEQINDIFKQTISGFQYLEKCNVLHRDIRPMNLLVSNEGELKVIDFGFGKQAINSTDYDNSVQLNWWCEPPEDFRSNVYDYCTEIYFVGKLFEGMIADQQITRFQYRSILKKMCAKNPAERQERFSEIRFALTEDSFEEIAFSDEEKNTYREFSDALSRVVTKFETETKFIDDGALILRKLEDLYRRVMLEEEVPSGSLVVRCFVSGGGFYSMNYPVSVKLLYKFIELLKTCSIEKRQIIADHFVTKLDCVEKYTSSPFDNFDDDIPF